MEVQSEGADLSTLMLGERTVHHKRTDTVHIGSSCTLFGGGIATGPCRTSCDRLPAELGHPSLLPGCLTGLRNDPARVPDEPPWMEEADCEQCDNDGHAVKGVWRAKPGVTPECCGGV